MDKVHTGSLRAPTTWNLTKPQSIQRELEASVAAVEEAVHQVMACGTWKQDWLTLRLCGF